MSAFQAERHRFESGIPLPLRGTFLCSSAVEPSTVNRLVAGSNPAGGAREISSVVEHLVYTEGVTGSNPVSPTGKVVEWFKASVLKTDEVRASVGSNPTLSVSGISSVW